MGALFVNGPAHGKRFDVVEGLPACSIVDGDKTYEYAAFQLYGCDVERYGKVVFVWGTLCKGDLEAAYDKSRDVELNALRAQVRLQRYAPAYDGERGEMAADREGEYIKFDDVAPVLREYEALLTDREREYGVESEPLKRLRAFLNRG